MQTSTDKVDMKKVKAEYWAYVNEHYVGETGLELVGVRRDAIQMVRMKYGSYAKKALKMALSLDFSRLINPPKYDSTVTYHYYDSFYVTTRANGPYSPHGSVETLVTP